MRSSRHPAFPIVGLGLVLAVAFSGCASSSLTVTVPRVEQLTLANPQAKARAG